MLLIVGDTWCAVTDPLRYHARVSKVKAWVLIATAWSLSILFGIASFFQSQFFSNTERNVTNAHHWAVIALVPAYNTIFSCSYFLVIILLPICFVCGMYWKIFSEAKQNGVRMRQNGSSPLLQSALNLAASAAAAAAANTPPTPSPTTPNPTNDGLIMKIDKHMNGTVTQATPTITTTSVHTQYLDVPPQPHVHKPAAHHKDKNYNTLFSFASGGGGSNKEQRRIARNCSARHLLDFDARSQLRIVRSTPNLQKSHHDQSSRGSAPHSTVLPLPNGSPIHFPPKALGYMTSIRHRLSNASSIFKYREESRAARISILVVIMCLVSYFPYGVLVLMHDRVVSGSQCQVLAAACVIIANMGSPFLFAYRNKRVRRGILRLFGCDAKTNERRQKRDMSLRRNMSTATLQRQQSQATLQKRASSSLSINSNRYFSPHKRKSDSDIDDDDELAFCCRRRCLTFWKRICDACRKLGCMTKLDIPEPVDV